MSDDYKYDMQMIAEEIAQAWYNTDFYRLSDDAQYQVYTAAEEKYRERICDRSDYLRKAERENR